MSPAVIVTAEFAICASVVSSRAWVVSTLPGRRDVASRTGESSQRDSPVRGAGYRGWQRLGVCLSPSTWRRPTCSEASGSASHWWDSTICSISKRRGVVVAWDNNRRRERHDRHCPSSGSRSADVHVPAAIVCRGMRSVRSRYLLTLTLLPRCEIFRSPTAFSPFLPRGIGVRAPEARAALWRGHCTSREHAGSGSSSRRRPGARRAATVACAQRG